MRYWTLLAVFALFSCSFSFTAQDTVEIPGNHSVDEKLKIAEEIGLSLWGGELKQHLQETIPELVGKNIDNMLGVSWGKHTSKNLVSSSPGNTMVYVKCIFKSSVPKSIARTVVDTCIEFAGAEIESRQAPGQILDSSLADTMSRQVLTDLDSSTAKSADSAIAVRGLSAAEFLTIRELLGERKFGQLNSLLTQYHDDYTQDGANEYRLVDAYRAFQMPDNRYESIISDWMRETPGSYQPYLAAAQYHYRKGWLIRGGSLGRDVPRQDKKKFKAELRHAAELVRQAITIDNAVMPAYLTIIDIEKSIDGHQQTSRTAAIAYDLFPDSVELRAAELKKYEPRWGGSFEKMQQLVVRAESSRLSKSKLGILQGMVHAERSRLSYIDDNYEQSLHYANNATLLGGYDRFFYLRGIANRELGNLQKALKDVNKAISYRPSVDDNYLLRANIHVMMGNFAAATADYKLAAKVWTKDFDHLERSTEWAANIQLNKASEVFQTNPAQAVAIYDDVLQLEPDSQYTVFWRAMALARMGMDEQAINGLKRSIEIDPKHFESYRELDYLLLKERRWNEIIANWDEFLQLEPEHADGFLERGGAHYQNGSIGQFQEDISRACDLQSAKACSIAASF